MPENAIHELDRAAIALLNAIDAHGATVRNLLDPGHLDALRRAVVGFREEILGLEMGPLYDGEGPEES
jgi:hypothetical protein